MAWRGTVVFQAAAGIAEGTLVGKMTGFRPAVFPSPAVLIFRTTNGEDHTAKEFFPCAPWRTWVVDGRLGLWCLQMLGYQPQPLSSYDPRPELPDAHLWRYLLHWAKAENVSLWAGLRVLRQKGCFLQAVKRRGERLVVTPIPRAWPDNDEWIKAKQRWLDPHQRLLETLLFILHRDYVLHGGMKDAE